MVNTNNDDILGMFGEDESQTNNTSQSVQTTSAGAASADLELIKKQLEKEKQRNDLLQSRLEQQTKMLNSLKAAVKGDDEKPKNDSHLFNDIKKEILSSLTEEERSQLGDKTLDVLSKIIAKPLEKMVDKIKKEVDEEIKPITKTVEENINEVFWSKVDRLAPGIKFVNESNDPAWVAFLDGIDPWSNRPRKEIADHAIAGNDVMRLALLYNEFKATQQATAAKEKSLTAEDLVRPEVFSASPDLSKVVNVDRIKQSTINEFYSNLAKGVYASKPDVAEKLDALISKAISEGRVIKDA